MINLVAASLPLVALLVAAPGCQSSAPTTSDACRTRMEDICAGILEYYALHDKKLPDKIDDIRSADNADLDLTFNCPLSGKPYIYNAVGLQAAAGDPMRLILYDSTPAHSGHRLGIVAGLPPERMHGETFQMSIVDLSEEAFQKYKVTSPRSSNPVASTCAVRQAQPEAGATRQDQP